MTLILAITCSDGVVLGAESASTDSESGAKQPVDKIKRVGDLPILYGGSGDAGLLQKIGDSLEGLSLGPNLNALRKAIKKRVIPVQQEAIADHVAYPQQGFNMPPPAIILFAGVSHQKPWILEIERNGGDTFYGDELGGFAAVGSGKPWAQAVFRPHLRSPRDLWLGKVFAHRVLEDSIDLAAGGLARPTHIYTISSTGTISQVADDEHSQLEKTCELWRTLEREAVGKLLATDRTETTDLEVPTPETN